MTEVAIDLADDRFDVRYRTDVVDAEGILDTIRALGYEPEQVLAEPAIARGPEVEVVELSRLPDELRAAFREAGARDAPVLLDFTAPG